jgi:malonyl-CoA decarboxylase
MFLIKRRGNVSRADELTTLCQALLSHRGEVSGARLAADAIRLYRSLDGLEIEAFLDRLVTKFAADLAPVHAAVVQFQQDASLGSLMRLRQAVEPPRQELFRRWNFAPGGTATLVDMRRRLLGTLKAHPERLEVDADFLHLFRSWFNRGFLVMQRIDWRTPAVILERLIEYEAVHQIQGWRDLRRRLEADRRCYAFFHPALP